MNQLLATITIGIVALFYFSSLSAQEATVRGKVIDAELGEPLLGATVALNQNGEIKTGTITDLDGTYSIKVDPGNYNLVVSYISFASDTITIEAIAGEVVLNETLLYEEGTLIETVVVKAKAVQTSDIAINLAKQNSINAIDGISVDFIKRTGDNNLAGALQRITGVSVEGGKYVTVRGLGDRYSKTLLNGGEIPALDPERNTTQMDIFPSNLVDNVIVYKNFTPDLPGSFTGGLVDIRTKSHPEDFDLSFSASFSYNPNANLKDDFLSYEGGGTDWLGIDDGSRDIPAAVVDFESREGSSIPQVSGGATTNEELALAVDEIAAAFPEYYTINNKTSSINQNYQLAFGNQMEIGGRPFGYNFGLSYRNSAQFRENFGLGRYVLEDTLGTVFENRSIIGELSEEEALWGAVLGLSYKISDKNKLSFNYMHNQSGTNQTRVQAGVDNIDLAGTGDSIVDHTMSFVERSIDAFQLRGEHYFGKLQLDWIGSYTLSSDNQPDFRVIQYSSLQEDELQLDENGIPVLDEFGQPVFQQVRIYNYQPSIHQAPQRYYRDLDEINQDLKINFTLPLTLRKSADGKFKFGGAYTYKDREFSEKQYNIDIDQGDFNSFDFGFRETGDLAAALDPKNFGIIDVRQAGSQTIYDFIASYFESSNPTNTYFADQTVIAAYGMVELPVLERLRLIAGLRYESTEINLETAPNLSGVFESGELNENDILPAAQLIYKVGSNMNLRGGYSRTLARPSFREFAPYSNFAFIGDFIITGNSELKRTLIDNYDFRYEWFPSPGELISVSGFYKNLDNPIERGFGRFSQTDLSDIFINNVESATAFGVELEVSKNFGFISEALRPLKLSGNIAFIESEVDLDEATLAVAQRFTGSTTRPLFGQPDYTLNGELAYIDNLNLGLQASISYSIFGERLSLVGGSNFNVYEQPRGLLNASIRKTIGEHLAIRVRANNLLDPDYRQVYKITQDASEEFLFENYKLGRSFSFGISYDL